MKTNELIAILRDEDDPNVLDYIQEAADTLQLQQARITELETELKDERHRHDRYVDFELAQAAELAKLKEERRWIPVTERLPDEDVRVIVRIDRTVWNTAFELDADRRHNGEWVRWGRAVTNWMPMPEPPKEGK